MGICSATHTIKHYHSNHKCVGGSSHLRNKPQTQKNARSLYQKRTNDVKYEKFDFLWNEHSLVQFSLRETTFTTYQRFKFKLCICNSTLQTIRNMSFEVLIKFIFLKLPFTLCWIQLMSFLFNLNEVHANIAESKELMNAKVIRVAVFSVSQKVMIKNIFWNN